MAQQIAHMPTMFEVLGLTFYKENTKMGTVSWVSSLPLSSLKKKKRKKGRESIGSESARIESASSLHNKQNPKTE